METSIGGNFQIKLPEMVRIPAGRYVRGGNSALDRGPETRINISSDFEISRYCITNGIYSDYLTKTGKYMPDKLIYCGHTNTETKIPSPVKDRAKSMFPVTGLSWYEASDFCQFISSNTGENYRLPTEAEWEYAAAGPESRLYPWGNEWNSSNLNFNSEALCAVDAHPGGANYFGVEDMVGNAMEWTNDWYAPYDQTILTDPKGPETGDFRVMRGGFFRYSDENSFRCATRVSEPPNAAFTHFGFRIVKAAVRPVRFYMK